MRFRIALTALLLAAGCRAGGPNTGADALARAGAPVPPSSSAPTAAQIAAARNHSCSLLPVLKARGTAEIRYREGGDWHFENGDLQMDAVLPGVASNDRGGLRAAFRLTKLGERALWIGCNGDIWWCFNMASKPSRLDTCATGRALSPDSGSSDLVSIVSPNLLLCASGLSPTTEASVGEISWDAQAGCWTSVVNGRDGVEKWWLDSSLRATRITVSGVGGKLVSELGDYKYARVPGIAHGAQPMVAHRVVLREDAGDEAPSASISLFFEFFESPQSVPREQMFDLDELKRVLAPEVMFDCGAEAAK